MRKMWLGFFTGCSKKVQMANTATDTLTITSRAFEEGGPIPVSYTCDGEEINPPLTVRNIPHGTATLAIITEDPDTSKGTFDHWLVWDIPFMETIEENTNPGISGTNGAGKTGYHGPCPPDGSHRYFFYVYALDVTLSLEAGANKHQLKEAMKNHILAEGTLMGRYEKVKETK